MVFGRPSRAPLERRSVFLSLLIGLSLLVFPVSAAGATDTGRSPGVSAGARSESRWAFCGGLGVFASGDLFQAELVPKPESLPTWYTPGGAPFKSDEFVVTLDEDLQVGATVFFRLQSRLWLRADWSWAQVDATAEAWASAVVDLHLYDRLTIMSFGLAAEYALLGGRTFPYVFGGGAVVTVTAAHAQGIDQNRFGPRLGVGFQQDLGSYWAGRVELRDTILQIETTGHEEHMVVSTGQAFEFLQFGPQHLVELTASIRMYF